MSRPAIAPTLDALRDEIWTDDGEPTDADLAEYLKHIVAIYNLASEWSNLKWREYTDDEDFESKQEARQGELETLIGFAFGDLR